MALVEEAANEALLSISSKAGTAVASRFVASRYRKLANAARLRHLRKVAELIAPANVTAGVATTTQGSQTVTGDATAQAAWLAVGAALAGRFFRIDTAWYEIAQLGPAGSTLTLVSPYAEASASGEGYSIVARYHRLPTDVQWLGPFVHPRLRRPLAMRDQNEMDLLRPNREQRDGGPQNVLQAPDDPNDGARRVELYPPAGTNDELVRFLYWAKPATLAQKDRIPNGVDFDMLVEGTMIDLMRWEMAEAVQRKDFEAAAHWRNEMNSSLTRWSRDYVNMAGELDQLLPDESVQLLLDNSTLVSDHDPIMTARDDIIANWRVP